MGISVADAAVPRDPRPFPTGPSNVLSQLSLAGKVIIITGAADGIGASVAEAMAEAGGSVALWYNSNPAAISKAESLSAEHSVKCKAYKCDVTDYAAVEATVAQVEADFGRLDVFIANAGMPISKPILEMSMEEYHLLNRVNVDGVYHCARAAGFVFKKQGSGNLIITSSMSARIVNVPVDQPVYNAGKAYVTHLGKSLALEWRDFARVNVVSPGFFDTKMGAGDAARMEAYRMAVLGRQGHVREIKGLYLYLASEASSFQTGSDTLIDGGYCLP